MPPLDSNILSHFILAVPFAIDSGLLKLLPSCIVCASILSALSTFHCPSHTIWRLRTVLFLDFEEGTPFQVPIACLAMEKSWLANEVL